jgi:hypothetical protein
MTIYERFGGAGTKVMIRPQSARCAGKVCRSATNSTFTDVPEGGEKTAINSD